MYHLSSKKTIKYLSSFFAIALVSVMLTSCGQNQNIIAEVGEEQITVDDFRQELIRKHKTEKDAARQDMASRERSLDGLVERLLKKAAAKEEGFFDTDEVLAKRKRFIEDAINQDLFQVEILNKVVTEELLRSIYEKQGEELQASHILLKWQADSSSVRQQLRTIQKELENGLAFEEAAKKYTEEPGGKPRAGELGWFSWGRMVAPFQEAAWQLSPGDVSDPVETQFGIHLIKLTSRRTIEYRPTFEDQRADLVGIAQKSQGPKIRETSRIYLEQLLEEKGFKVANDISIELLTAVQANMGQERSLFNVFESILGGQWTNRVLADWDTAKLTIEDLTKWLENNSRPPSSISTADDINELIENATMSKVILERAFDLGLDKKEAVVASVDQRITGVVLSNYERNRIKGNAKVVEENIAAYYQSHMPDFMHSKKVSILEVYVKDKDLATELSGKLKAGADFKTIARKYTERPGKKNTDGTLEPFGPGRYGKMGEAAFKMKPGEISDPLPIGQNWAVIKLIENLPPKQKLLDECRTSIRMKLEREARNKAIEDWRKEMEAKIPIKLHKALLKTVFAD
jgi:parvulin-like peptidyl-prolyl isomerase